MDKIGKKIKTALNESEKSLQVSKTKIDKVEALLVQAQNILISIVEEHGIESNFGKLVHNDTLFKLEQVLTQGPGSIESIQAKIYKATKKF